VVVAVMGPGVVGTDSPLGTSAVEVAAVLDATAALGGRPILCPRASSGDRRPRHQGISHHTRTALGLVRSPVEVPVPPELADDPVATTVVVPPDPTGVLHRADLAVTTMGRGPGEDPLFFATAAAAGAFVARLVAERA
ncbi:MAG: DUF3866 family protein, partial [Acidimicrobiia bacterium]